MIHKRPAYLMLELLLVIGVVVGFLGFFYTNIYVPQQKSLMSKEDLKNQVVIKRIVNQYIKLAAAHNRAQYAAQTVVPPENFIALEPLSGDAAGRISFKMHKDIIDNNIFMSKDLVSAKCVKAGDSGDYYNYRCLAVGDEITFLEVAKTNTLFNNIYTNEIPIFTMRKLVHGRFVGSKEFTYMDTYLMFRDKSLDKLNILRKRLESFNRIVYVNEIGNPCSFEGGLDSWDDFNIPWIWRVHSEPDVQGGQGAQSETCLTPIDPNATPKVVCSCQNYELSANKWSTDYNIVQVEGNGEVDRYERILTNLSLPKTYRYDEVGNPLSIILFAQVNAANGPAVLTNTPPPAPHKDYNVDPGGSFGINHYRQGELFVRPAVRAAGEYMENSRIVYFYD